jgi:biopolymer transport protein ExbD
MSGADLPSGHVGEPGRGSPNPSDRAPAGQDASPYRGSNLPPQRQASVVRYKAALRKAIRLNAREPEVDFLNITAMLDLMTIILVFLLKSMSASSASIPQSKDLTLPSSIITTEAAQEGVVIVISKSQILVGDEPTPIVLLPGPEQLAQSGVDTKYKRSGPNDMYIVPLANALAHAHETDKAIRQAKHEKDTSSSEAVIVADATTPYRLLIEVLFTAGQSEFGKYHLMVRSGKKK